jgi:hypothetical protein
VQELTCLRKQLGPSDVRTVNQYTDEIREIERGSNWLRRLEQRSARPRPAAGNPRAVRRAHQAALGHAGAAFKADITRVVTLLGARDLTGRVYPFPKSDLFPDGGTSVSFHGGSHHQDDPCRSAGTPRSIAITCRRWRTLAKKLKSIPDGDGTLLDRSLILYGSNMGNSNQHQHYDVAHLLVGAPTAAAKATGISSTTGRR